MLYPTDKGRRLALELAGLQSERFQRALVELPATARSGAIEFLLAMIDPGERDKVRSTVWKKPELARPRVRP